ncbi:MAG TPA: hypothetical protein VK641_15840 [Terriglobales bacterium]|nr:hypothetical protein [Terriglobales bacterium]
MKHIRVAVLSGLVLMFGACGSSRLTWNINGFWGAGLNNPDGSPAFAFSMNLTQGSGTAVNVANFSFVPAPSCFPSSTGQSVVFTATGSSNGNVTGSFAMSISTLFPGALNNVLSLQGDRNATGRISGTWTLTGQSGCTGTTGTFLMSLPV